LTASKVKMMFTAIDVAADQEWLRQREVRRAAKQAATENYRRGWQMHQKGERFPHRSAAATQAGWRASRDAAKGRLGKEAESFGGFVASVIVALADVEVQP
jgi:hypothetical protein